MEYIKKKRESLPEKEKLLSSDLPKHVIERINRYFSTPELGIEKLRKTWSSVSEQPFLWLKLDFRGDVTSADMICHILKNSPLLESLRLTNVPDVVSVLRQVCRCCKRLKHLTVRFCHTGEDALHQVAVPESALRNIISSCPNLTYLNLKGTPFFGRIFYHELVHLRKLRSLRIGYNSLLRPRDLLTIAGACRGRLAHFSLVHSLNGPPPRVRIYGSEVPKTSRRTNRDRFHSLRDYSAGENPQPLTSRECSFLVEMLGADLLSLELEAGAVDGQVFRLLFSRCPNLRCLRLFNAINLPGDVVRRIPSAMPRLAHLTLRNAYLASDEDLLDLVHWGEVYEQPPSDSESVFASDASATSEEREEAEDVELVDRWWEGGFPSEEDKSEKSSQGNLSQGKTDSEQTPTASDSPCLLSLELNMCPSVTDAVLSVLSEGPRAASLQTLGLRGCQRVTDNGLGFLRKCSKLKHLDVSFVNGMKGPSGEWFKSLPSDLPSLSTLVVGFSNEDVETEKAIGDLIKTKPTLHIKKCLSFYNSRELILS